MARYLLKEFKSGKRRIAFVSNKAVYGCPHRGIGEVRHSDSLITGNIFHSELDRTVERSDDDGRGNYTKRTTIVMIHGKVDDKHLPICKCGREFVRLGYHFTIHDEWHDKKHVIGGFLRNSMDDKTLEDKWFSRRKSALAHLDVAYKRASELKRG